MRWWVVVALVFGLGAVAHADGLDELVGKLGTPDAEHARTELERRGKAAVPALRAGLSSANELRRLHCIRVLARIGRDAAEAKPDLLELLVDDSNMLREAAAGAIGRVASYEPMLAMRLSGSINGEAEVRVKKALIQSLALLGKDAAEAVSLVVRNQAHRHTALVALQDLGEEAAPVLVALLANASWHVRMWIARIYWQKRVPPVMPASWFAALARACRDPAEAVRHAAVSSLARLAYMDERPVPHLIGLLDSNDDRVRTTATYGLAQPEATSPDIAKALLPLASDVRWKVRLNVAAALANASREPAITAALVKRLDDDNPDVRAMAAHGLATSDAARDAVDRILVERARTEHVRPPYAIYTLGRTTGRRRFESDVVPVPVSHPVLVERGAKAVSHVERGLAGRPIAEQMSLVHTLGRIGAPAADALERLLKHANRDVRSAAACCLAQLGDRGRAAVPLLITLAEPWSGEEPIVGAPMWPYAAEEALVALGPIAAPAVEAALEAGDAKRQAYLRALLERIRKAK